MDNDIRLDLNDVIKYLDKQLDLWVTHEKDDLAFCMAVVNGIKKLTDILTMACETWETTLNHEIDAITETRK